MKQFNLKEYLENPERKIITGNGRDVRIICINRKNEDYPIVALLIDSTGNHEETYHYTMDGKWVKGETHSSDLFFAPKKKEYWINIYKDFYGSPCTGTFYETEEEALTNKSAALTYLSTVKVEWEE